MYMSIQRNRMHVFPLLGIPVDQQTTQPCLGIPILPRLPSPSEHRRLSFLEKHRSGSTVYVHVDDMGASYKEGTRQTGLEGEI